MRLRYDNGRHAPYGGHRVRRIAKEGLIVGAGQALTVAGRFVTVWWLTRRLDPAAFGEVALLQGLAALGFAFVCGPLLQAGLRFYPEAARDARLGALHGLLRPSVARLAWLTAGVLMVGVFGWGVATGHGVDPLAIAAGLLIVVPDAFRLYEANALNAARRQGAFAAWSVADALARPAGAAIAIALLGPTAGAALLGVVASAFLVNIVAARWVERDASGPADEPWERATRIRVRRFAAPLVPLAVTAWTVGLADRYVLAATRGTDSAGLYAAVYGLGSQGFLALGLVGITVFRPPFFDAVEGGDPRRTRRVLGAWLAAMTAGAVLGVCGLALWSGPIARIGLGPEFRGAAPLLPWIGAAYALQTLQTAFEVVLYARHKTRVLLPVQLAGAATALALYAILIPRYGALGAAIATLASFAVSSALAAAFGDVLGILRAKPSLVAPRETAV